MTPTQVIHATVAAIAAATTAEAKARALAEGLNAYSATDIVGAKPIAGWADMTSEADCVGQYGAWDVYGFIAAGADGFAAGAVYLTVWGDGGWGVDALDMEFWQIAGDQIVPGAVADDLFEVSCSEVEALRSVVDEVLEWPSPSPVFLRLLLAVVRGLGANAKQPYNRHGSRVRLPGVSELRRLCGAHDEWSVRAALKRGVQTKARIGPAEVFGLWTCRITRSAPGRRAAVVITCSGALDSIRIQLGER